MSDTYRDEDSVYETSFQKEAGFINKATDFVLSGVNGILASALDSAEDITAALIEQASGTLILPLFSEFYNRIIGGQPTLLKLASLLIAIPVTALYKAERDRAPFENESDVDSFVRTFLEAADDGLTDVGSVASIFSL